MEANYSKRCTEESFFINQKATEVNVLNRIDGANMPIVYGYAYGLILCCVFDSEVFLISLT